MSVALVGTRRARGVWEELRPMLLASLGFGVPRTGELAPGPGQVTSTS